MAIITAVDNEQFSLWFHEESRIVHHQFHGFVYGEAFRSCLLEGVTLLRKYGANKWLSDDRANSAISKEDFEWSTTEWRREAMNAGWRYWAVVLPEKVVGQMSLQKIFKQYEKDSPVVAKLFTDPEPAMAWLVSQ